MINRKKWYDISEFEYKPKGKLQLKTKNKKLVRFLIRKERAEIEKYREKVSFT